MVNMQILIARVGDTHYMAVNDAASSQSERTLKRQADVTLMVNLNFHCTSW